jgi:hypothetical protein
MSSSTWTPAALSSEAKPLAGTCWRVVEAQHRVSTLKIVDSLEEQELLEALIEEVKPPVPPECRHLHYLLSTPFRYGSAYPHGSRFRRAGFTEGVFYAAERPETAVAELAFHRLLFFAESPGTPWPSNPSEHTAFAAELATGRAIDLTAEPFAASSATWMHPTDYTPCQTLADGARAAAIDAIRYASVRDPEHRPNLAILACRVFPKPEPTAYQSWRLHFHDGGVLAVCETPRTRLAFARTDFADRRLA